MQDRKTKNIKKKKLINKVIGEIIQEKRKTINKGILLLSYEYDIPTSSLIQVEKGERDLQISTLWRIANAFGLNASEILLEAEKRLPEGFNLIDD